MWYQVRFAEGYVHIQVWGKTVISLNFECRSDGMTCISVFQKEKAQLDGNSIRDPVPLQSHLLPFWFRGTARVWLVEVGTQHGTWTSDAATWVVQTLSLFFFISPYITCFPQGVHSLVCVCVRKHVAHMRERCERMSHVLELFDYLTQKVTAHKHYTAF